MPPEVPPNEPIPSPAGASLAMKNSKESHSPTEHGPGQSVEVQANQGQVSIQEEEASLEQGVMRQSGPKEAIGEVAGATCLI